MNNGKEYAVQMHGITKRFGSFTALDGMDLDVKKGSIHSILGENGAGKSTLMNVLYGLYQPEEGEIFIDGEEVRMKSPNVALEHGIGMVHQHFKLVGCFTVTQNIVLGLEPVRGMGVLDMKEARKRVIDITQKYGLDGNLKSAVPGGFDPDPGRADSRADSAGDRRTHPYHAQARRQWKDDHCDHT